MVAIRFKNNRLFYLDQTQLPLKEVWRECRNLKDGFIALKQLRVRGAPLIGVFAAYCIAVSIKHFSLDKERFLKQLKEAVIYLKSCRPTAVNLFWALERLEKAAFENINKSLPQIKKEILEKAVEIHREDIALCQNMADYGLKLIKKGDRILTHCNTGFLATSGEGTALAVIYKAYKVYKNIKVYIDETRPLLQGARLTAWELTRRRLPCTLICDNMAAYLMQKGEIDKVFVGADRITSYGDVANKIGTYNVAVISYYHKIPFYVVAPFSSFDLKLKSGKEIPIEQRKEDEVRRVLNKTQIAPGKINAFNPAFDITPSRLVAAIVSDRGLILPPFKKNIRKTLCP
jgi:methylthioribose-1-phosphate isomerase